MIDLIKPTFAPYQTDILYCKERFSVVEAATKIGKTFSHLYWIFEIAQGGNPQWYTNNVSAGMEFWWVAPIYKQARIAFKRLKRKVQGIEGYLIREGELSITTPYGTIIAFKGADNPDSLYGEDVYAIVFDEFTRAKQDAWFAIRSTLTATGGPCKFIGNYTGSMNWGHKLGQKALTDSDFFYRKVDSYEAVKAGILKEEEIEGARRQLPKPIFNALYLVKGSSSDDILFDNSALEALSTNSYVTGGNRKYITADVALHGSDRFVIGVWDDWILEKVYKVDKSEADEVETLLRGYAKTHRVQLTNIVYDSDGVGAFLRGYLKQAKPFNNGGSPIFKKSDKIKPNYKNLKTQCAYEISKPINRGEMWIKDDYYIEDIKTELEVLRKHNTDEDGKLQITPKKEMKKLLGFSPDFADMILMRYYFELTKQKGSNKMGLVNRRHYPNTQQNRR